MVLLGSASLMVSGRGAARKCIADGVWAWCCEEVHRRWCLGVVLLGSASLMVSGRGAARKCIADGVWAWCC